MSNDTEWVFWAKIETRTLGSTYCLGLLTESTCPDTELVANLLEQESIAVKKNARVLAPDDGCSEVVCGLACPEGKAWATDETGCRQCQCYEPAVECPVFKCGVGLFIYSL